MKKSPSKNRVGSWMGSSQYSLLGAGLVGCRGLDGSVLCTYYQYTDLGMEVKGKNERLYSFLEIRY